MLDFLFPRLRRQEAEIAKLRMRALQDQAGREIELLASIRRDREIDDLKAENRTLKRELTLAWKVVACVK